METHYLISESALNILTRAMTASASAVPGMIQAALTLVQPMQPAPVQPATNGDQHAAE